MSLCDRLFGIVVNTSDCHPRDSGVNFWLYLRNFHVSIGFREDKWAATLYEKQRNPVKETEIKVEG